MVVSLIYQTEKTNNHETVHRNYRQQKTGHFQKRNAVFLHQCKRYKGCRKGWPPIGPARRGEVYICKIKKMKKETRGGARKGAGRPVTKPPTKTISVRVPASRYEELKEKIKAIVKPS